MPDNMDNKKPISVKNESVVKATPTAIAAGSFIFKPLINSANEVTSIIKNISVSLLIQGKANNNQPIKY